MKPARILIVEDEPGLLRVLVRYLSRLGYEATAAACAQEAIRAFQKDPDAFAAALADLSLPDMRGEDLAARLIQSRPSLPVLLTSGSPAALAGIQAPAGGRFACLQKPFTANMLAEALEALLGRAGSP